MKVLWFTNSLANADEYFNQELTGTGGWLKSLDIVLQDYVELHVAFYKQYDEIFKYKSTHYHPIKINDKFIAKFLKKVRNHVIDEEDLNEYLKIIRRIKPDIIHIHGTENPFACIIPYTEVPVILSIQGNITVYLHKYFSGFDKEYLRIRKWELSSLKRLLFPESFQSHYKRFVMMQSREEKNLKLVKNIIGRTDWDKRISRVLSPLSSYYHNDEILREIFYSTKWTMPENDKLIIHTTNSNTFYKGFETICQTLYLLDKLKIDCEWRVAGVKEDDLIVKLTKKMLKGRFPNKGLRLLGSLNEKKLVNSLLESHLYVMPSHIENSPNNLCEAMLLGMPCISTYAGGSSSMLIDKTEGLLIQDGDPFSMAGAIIELYEHPEKAIQYGLNAKEKAVIRHNPAKIVKELIQIYELVKDRHCSLKTI